MRAVLIKDGKGPAQNLYIGSVEQPTPGPEEVLVKVKAFGLNRMDISQREGLYPPPPGSSSILGVEFSGEITQLGNKVKDWKIGDPVLGLVGGGAYAEYINVLQTHIIKKPDNLTWAEAASIPENFLTAFQALVLIGKVQSNENVLVHAGASGVGVAAIQLARFYGTQKVIATTSTQEKIDWLLNLPNGATNAANYKTEDFASVVKDVTQGHGADVIIDFVGRTHFNRNIESLAVDGRMILLAILSGPIVENVNLGLVLRKRLRIQGSTLRARSRGYQAELIEKFRKEAFPHITGETGSGNLKVYIHKVYPWEKIIEAHNEMELNKNSGKIIVEVV